LHRPWRQATGTKNPRWGEEEEDDAAEKGTNEGIMVFTLAKRALFIKHCNTLPFAKGRTPVLCAIPWISR
jgi:hypothetical protein